MIIEENLNNDDNFLFLWPKPQNAPFRINMDKEPEKGGFVDLVAKTNIINAALKCISQRTSYHKARLAFHLQSQVIQVLYNAHWFDLTNLLIIRSPCFGSNTFD